MATRKPPPVRTDPVEVDRMAREMLPSIEWHADAGEWADHTARCAVRHREYRAFVESHGYSPLDLMRALRPRPAPTKRQPTEDRRLS